VSTTVDLVAVFALFVFMLTLLYFCVLPFYSVNKDSYQRRFRALPVIAATCWRCRFVRCVLRSPQLQRMFLPILQQSVIIVKFCVIIVVYVATSLLNKDEYEPSQSVDRNSQEQGSHRTQTPPPCCHLRSYFKRPKSSPVRPLACN